MVDIPQEAPPWVSISRSFLPSENFQTRTIPSASPDAKILSSLENVRERTDFRCSI